MTAKKKPAYLHHKPSGQARVRIDGKDHYLGEYGTAESYEHYQDKFQDDLFRRISRHGGHRRPAHDFADITDRS